MNEEKIKINTVPIINHIQKINFGMSFKHLLQIYASTGTFKIVFRWLAISLQNGRLLAAHLSVQCDGGFGSTAGEGGSENLAPA